MTVVIHHDSISDRVTCVVSTVMSLTPSRTQDWGRARNRNRRRKDRTGQDRTAALVVQFVVT